MKKAILDEIQRARFLPLRLIGEGLLVGVVSGIIVMLYRLALQQAEHILSAIIAFTSHSAFKMAGWFVVLVLLALVVGRLLRFEPLISGSGIPQLEGEMAGKLDQTWWKVLPAKFFGGALCLVAGLSLGREGPSIQLGAMGGKVISKLFSVGKSEEKYLLTCGASAGLAAAFHAPLAGVMFSLEELHKNFSVSVLMSVMTASITADYLTSRFLGNNPVFQFQIVQEIPMQYYGFILVLGIILGFLGAFYNWSTLKVQSLFQNCKFLNQTTRLLVPFLLAGILAYTAPVLLGSGGNIITLLTDGKLALHLAVVLLIAKFLFSNISFGSGAPGGIFFPLLVLGGTAGGIFGMVCNALFGVPADLVNNFVLLAMAGFFTAIVRAPLTGILLIFEMTGSLSQLASLSLVSVAAFVVASLLKSEPIYESLLSRILKRQGHKISDCHEKVLREYVIMHTSALDAHTIGEIAWPKGALIVAIRRGSEELLPTGSTLLHASDTLLVLLNSDQEAAVHDTIVALCSE